MRAEARKEGCSSCAGVEGSPKGKSRDALGQITSSAEQLGIPVHTASKHDLNLLCEQRPHQVAA